jgi:LPS export ABC transporter protein LptC
MRSILAYGIALLFLASATACENDPAEVNSITQKDTLPLLTTHNVDMLFSDSARLKIHMTAPLEEEFGGIEQKTILPQGVFVKFYDDSGKVNSTMQSQYAERHPKEHLTIAKQKVVVVNIKGEKLETEKLTWNEQTNRISTDAFVKITTADQVIWGDGLEADAAFTEYEIKNIEGTLMINDNETP